MASRNNVKDMAFVYASPTTRKFVAAWSLGKAAYKHSDQIMLKVMRPPLLLLL